MATKNGDLLKELLTQSGVERKDDEGDQAFYKRLQAGLRKKSDEDWGKMSDAAQDWSNRAQLALDDGKAIKAPAGAEPAKANDNDNEEKPPKKQKAAAAKTKADKKKSKKEKEPKAAKEGKKAKKAKPEKEGKKKKAKSGVGRPRLDDSATLKRKVKKLPEDGHRNKYWDKIPDGTSLKAIRKNKTHMRVVRYWKRNKFVDLVAA